MNRTDLQVLARLRAREARLLLRNRQYEGAYYLSGYVIEAALKACIAKQTQRHDFPDKSTVNESYTHDLKRLVRVAGLQPALDAELSRDRAFEVNWSLVKDWSEESRYERPTRTKAEDLHRAIIDRRHGVMRWIRQHW